MKILVDNNILLLKESLEACAEVESFTGRELTNEILKESKCGALFVRSTTKVNEKLLKDTAVKFVGTSTSGIDHVDTKYLKKNGIHFVSAPGSNANSVAELVVFSMLKWARKNKTKLRNKTIGIVGFGHIGSIVGKYALYYNMNVLVNDPPLLKKGFQFPEGIRHCELEDLCASADILTNHVPLIKDGDFATYHLIDRAKIESMPRYSLLIHTSRGSVVEEKPLIHKIKGRNFDVAIDVWENEPLINKDLAILTMLATPHIAGYSKDGKLRGALMMAEEFEKIFELKPNYEDIKRELSYYKPMPKFNFRDFEYLYTLMLKNRRFADDHNALLTSLLLPDEKRAKAFDDFRKNYPERRESL